jgi:DNA polymerase-3 subunit epsilon
MRLAFVDLETTGGSPVDDRITEVGIIAVDFDETDPAQPPQPVREWSTLVNPDATIPPFIETLTGITNAMVATAPRFEDLAADILERLDGRLFVAHNARFDHGFLKNAFRRLGHTFRPPVLCTVRLSRKLYPGHARHNLDTLIERHRLSVDLRHRALGDARLLWQLWQRFHAALPSEQIAQAIDQLTARPSLPRHLDPDVLDTLPRTAGVYLFHGAPTDDEPCPAVEEPRPLYIGKAKNLRQRVMAHFTGDHLSAREMEISQQMTRIDWIETGGGTQRDLGALLTEATLVKRLMPAYNRLLRRSDDTCAWRLVVDRTRRIGKPGWRLAIARPDDLFFAQDRDLHGPFATPRQAGVALRAIADAHGLCPVLLRLDKGMPGKPCFAHQVRRCRGACIGAETVDEHTARLKEALSSLAIRPWPFAGPVAFREGHRLHVLDGWAYLGMASSLDEAHALGITQRPFDADVYRLLARRVNTLDVVPLDR